MDYTMFVKVFGSVMLLLILIGIIYSKYMINKSKKITDEVLK